MSCRYVCCFILKWWNLIVSWELLCKSFDFYLQGVKRTEDTSTVDDEGNWKRRKVANAEEEDEDADADVCTAPDESRVIDTVVTKPVVKEETSEKVPTNGSEKYDPLEADAEESNPEDESKDAQSEMPVQEEEEEKGKIKDDTLGDDNLWAEVDRDIGSLLETVDGEAETESLNDMMEEELLTVKQEPDSATRGSRASNRNKATRGSPAAKTRGKKKK